MEKIFAYYLSVLKNYTKFDGRARRAEFWYFTLINMIIYYILGYINGFLSIIYYLGILIPSLAVAIRRMHDVGKSGWFILIPIYNIVLAATAGETGDNQYGSDPKDTINEAIDFN